MDNYAESATRPLAVLLDLVPFKCALQVTTSADAKTSVVLSYDLKVPLESDVLSSDGRTLTAVDWQLVVERGDMQNEHVISLGGMGMLHHYSRLESDDDVAEELCAGWFRVSDDTFQYLWECAKRELLPTEIRLKLRGAIRFGFDLHGRETVWDITQKDGLVVEEVVFGYPLAQRELNFSLGQGADAEPSEQPSSGDQDLLAPTPAEQFGRKIDRLISLCKWILVLLLVLTAISAIR